jgi:hypothetical protein
MLTAEKNNHFVSLVIEYEASLNVGSYEKICFNLHTAEYQQEIIDKLDHVNILHEHIQRLLTGQNRCSDDIQVEHRENYTRFEHFGVEFDRESSSTN